MGCEAAREVSDCLASGGAAFEERVEGGLVIGVGADVDAVDGGGFEGGVEGGLPCGR